MHITIRQERTHDFPAIRTLVREAFASAEHSDGNEHNLVDQLRGSEGFFPSLALVAEVQGQLVGHIMFTKVLIGDAVGLALAPLSVLPSAQRQGVGIALMREGHRRAKELGFAVVVVLGSERYYPKAGYERASDFGIVAPFAVPDENFMVLWLQDSHAPIRGTVVYVKEIFEG